MLLTVLSPRWINAQLSHSHTKSGQPQIRFSQEIVPLKRCHGNVLSRFRRVLTTIFPVSLVAAGIEIAEKRRFCPSIYALARQCVRQNPKYRRAKLDNKSLQKPRFFPSSALVRTPFGAVKKRTSCDSRYFGCARGFPAMSICGPRRGWPVFCLRMSCGTDESASQPCVSRLRAFHH